jgi:hypothetical protein
VSFVAGFLRLLRERLLWWLVPMLVIFGLTAYLAFTRLDPEPIMPMRYDLPGEP